MSWLEKLYRTYEECAGNSEIQVNHKLIPPFHVMPQAHIQIAIDGDGNFRRASVVEKEPTLIPATEKSATARTSAIVPHALCDYVKYCAGDSSPDGGSGNQHFNKYYQQLSDWCESEFAHPKARAVLKYVSKQTTLYDLIQANVLPTTSDGEPMVSVPDGNEKPELFRQLTAKKGVFKPLNSLIRWVVEIAGDVCPEVWRDRSLQQAWIEYCRSLGDSNTGICAVTGVTGTLAVKHPFAIGTGKAKLISNKNEKDSDFVYLGRFHNARQAIGIDLEVSLKAHSALRWLVERQGYRNGDQVFVAWNPAGKPLPEAFENTAALFGNESLESDNSKIETASEATLEIGDVGQAFAIRLRNAIAGYSVRLDPTDEVIVIGLDSATKGRMAITFYREITGTDFLRRIQIWHERFAWPQRYGKKLQFVGAPSPKDIAEAAYGSRLDDKLKRSTIERIIPCIVDAIPIPRDLVVSLHNRVSNRVGLEDWEFEKCLGITCSLYKGYSSHNGKEYAMTLETENNSRDYLFGRLLAIAEHIEARALHLSNEKRDTNAGRHMHRFSDRPYPTWQTIELALLPYRAQLRSKRPSILLRLEKVLDEVMSQFKTEDFKSDKKLSSEFLLAYHCQRRELWQKPDDADETTNEN